MNKNKQFVITINREVGSGGRTVGRLLAERLNVKYYDKVLVAGLTEKFGLTLEEIERIKAQKKTWWNEFNNYYKTLVNSPILPMEAEMRLTTESMFETEKAILEGLAQEESCVVAGRSSFLVFRDWQPNYAVSNPHIVNSLHPELDHIALRAVKKMPRWVPAYSKEGKPIRSIYQLQVPFYEE